MFSVRGKKMFSYLSWYYENSQIMQSALDSQGTEIDAVRTALEETLQQFYVDTATWGLDRWERELALTPPINAPVELRRALINVKLLAREIMTPERLQVIANQFVTEKTAIVREIPKTYTFTVEVPLEHLAWTREMLNALEEAKPAHLAMYLLAQIQIAVTIEHTAETLAFIDAKHCSWNLGTAKTARRNGVYKRDRTIRRNGLAVDAFYRERQYHGFETVAQVDSFYNTTPDQGSLTTALLISNYRTDLQYVGAISSLLESRQTIVIDGINNVGELVAASHTTNHRTANIRNRSQARDASHKRGKRFIQDGFVNNLCTIMTNGRAERL